MGWRAGRCNIQWERTIASLDGNQITIDVPITTAIDQEYGGALVAKIAGGKRTSHVGIEDVSLASDFDANQPTDEQHCWFGIVANNVENAWIRRVRFKHFAGGAVLLREGVRSTTVVDCLMLAPVSELGGYRRNSFFTQGQQTLFLRCHAEDGMHDFAAGHCAPGPNAFVNCYAARANADSGPLEAWASGVLYDNVRIDGSALTLANRWTNPPGAGWSAANCVLWQCQAAVIRAFNPPGANNWVLGYWAEPQGDAHFFGQSEFLRPISLYQAQLRAPRGNDAADAIAPLTLDPIASTNPTVAEAQDFVAESNLPMRALRDVIEERIEDAGKLLRAAPLASLPSVSMTPSSLEKSARSPGQQCRLTLSMAGLPLAVAC